MKYIFGTVFRKGQDVENVKTIGSEHSDLKGFCHIERAYPDNIITDDFKIVEKYHSDETEEACFDWYEITEHNRIMDKFSPAKEKIDGGIADSQDATCELSEELDERITDIENALCELTEE